MKYYIKKGDGFFLSPIRAEGVGGSELLWWTINLYQIDVIFCQYMYICILKSIIFY